MSIKFDRLTSPTVVLVKFPSPCRNNVIFVRLLRKSRPTQKGPSAF